MKRSRFRYGGNLKYDNLYNVMNTNNDINKAGQLMTDVLIDIPFDEKKQFYDNFKSIYPDGGKYYNLDYNYTDGDIESNKFSLIPKDQPKGFQVPPVQPLGRPKRDAKTAIGRTMGRINPKGIYFKTGGFLEDNLGNIITGVGGAAMLGMGNPAGLGMLSTGVAGILGNIGSTTEPDPNEEINQWIQNNRHNYINNRTMNRSMFRTGGRATGGSIVPMSSDEQLAVGNTHEEGGIQMPFGEIEDQEVLRNTGDGTQIYSDMLGYADPAQELATHKGQLELQYQQISQQIAAYMDHMDKLNSQVEDPRMSKFDRNKVKREFDKIAKDYTDLESNAQTIQEQISQIDMQLDQLAQQQEQEAEMMGMRDEQGMPTEQPMFGTGGKRLNIHTVNFDRNTGDPIFEDDISEFALDYRSNLGVPSFGRNTHFNDPAFKQPNNLNFQPNLRIPSFGGNNDVSLKDKNVLNYQPNLGIPSFADNFKIMNTSPGISRDLGNYQHTNSHDFTTPNFNYNANLGIPSAFPDSNINVRNAGNRRAPTSNSVATESRATTPQGAVNNNSNNSTNRRDTSTEAQSSRVLDAHTIQPMPTLSHLGSNAKLKDDYIDNNANKLSKPELQDRKSSGLKVGYYNKDRLKEQMDDNFDYVKSLPFISNVASAFLQGKSNRRKPPKGGMLDTPTLDPNVDISAQQNAIRSQVRSAEEGLDSNVNNAAIRRSNRANIAAQGANAESNLVNQAQNIGRQTRNQNLSMAAQIAAQNQQTDFFNQQLDDAHFRQNLTSIGANIANIESKLQQYVSQGRMDEYQRTQIELLGKLLSGSIPGELGTIAGLFKTEDEFTRALTANGVHPGSDNYKKQLAEWKRLNSK